MNDKQKIAVSYSRDPSMDLPEADAAAEFAQYLEDLRKVDPSIPPMPEEAGFVPNPDYDSAKPLGAWNWPDTVDPLCAQARWWGEFVLLPLLAEDFNGGDRHAFRKALVLVAEHQLPPPAWLASAMLKEFSEKAIPKNIQDDKRHTIGMTPEDVQQMYASMKADRQTRLAEGMAEVALLRERGLHKKAEIHEQQTRDKFKPTMEVIAKDDMNISLAHLKRLLKLVKDREEQQATQREAIAERQATIAERQP